MDFSYDPFSEIGVWLWYYEIWQRPKKYLSDNCIHTFSQILIQFKFLLTLSYDSQWQLCNLSDICTRHSWKPLGNEKRSRPPASCTRYKCNVLHWLWKLEEKKGAQKIKFNHNLKRLTFHESSQTLRYCIGILFIVIYLICNTPSSLIIADAETQNQLALLSVCWEACRVLILFYLSEHLY